MINIILKHQKLHFDKDHNQYNPSKILKPPIAQVIEIDHLKRLVTNTKTKSILDFGAGTGRMTLPFLKSGFDVTAVDVSEVSLIKLDDLYRKNKTKHWGKLALSKTMSRSRKFDAVIGSDILHHVPISESLREIYEVLKPGGIAVFSEPNAWHLPWYLFIASNDSWDIEKGILHCTISNLKKEFLNAGFRNFNIEGHGLFPTLLFNFSPRLCRFNAYTLGKIFKPLSFRFLVIGMK